MSGRFARCQSASGSHLRYSCRLSQRKRDLLALVKIVKLEVLKIAAQDVAQQIRLNLPVQIMNRHLSQPSGIRQSWRE